MRIFLWAAPSSRGSRRTLELPLPPFLHSFGRSLRHFVPCGTFFLPFFLLCFSCFGKCWVRLQAVLSSESFFSPLFTRFNQRSCLDFSQVFPQQSLSRSNGLGFFFFFDSVLSRLSNPPLSHLAVTHLNPASLFES